MEKNTIKFSALVIPGRELIFLVSERIFTIMKVTGIKTLYRVYVINLYC